MANKGLHALCRVAASGWCLAGKLWGARAMLLHQRHGVKQTGLMEETGTGRPAQNIHISAWLLSLHLCFYLVLLPAAIRILSRCCALTPSQEECVPQPAAGAGTRSAAGRGCASRRQQQRQWQRQQQQQRCSQRSQQQPCGGCDRGSGGERRRRALATCVMCVTRPHV